MHTKVKTRALRAAFPHTLPVMAGYVFLGMTYGVFMDALGYAPWHAALMSLFVFAGSMQFVAANLFLGAFNPLQALAVTLMVNARHLFYGLAMLDKYRGLGKRQIYMIAALTDETFSVNCAAEIPQTIDRGWFMFFVTLLDQSYWVLGTLLGSLVGMALTFNTEGLDFVMTAMFVVIFIEQWQKDRNPLPAWAGLGLTTLCLVAFGPDSFLIPAMIAILAVLTLCRPLVEGRHKA